MKSSGILSEYSDVLKPDDLKNILGIGRNTVYEYLSNGTIQSIRIGKQYRIPKKYLIDFLYPDSDTVYEAVNKEDN